MITEILTGPRSVTKGAQAIARGTTDSALVVAQASGKYIEAVKEGHVFVGANQAAAALTAGFATTYTGLVLSNPRTSQVNLALLRAGFTLSAVASAASAIGLMTGINPTTEIVASITPRNRLVGGPAGSARVSASVDLTGGVPVLEQLLTQLGTLATTGQAIGQLAEIDLDGSLILPPGAYVAFWSAAAFTAAFWGSFMWEEIPR